MDLVGKHLHRSMYWDLFETIAMHIHNGHAPSKGRDVMIFLLLRPTTQSHAFLTFRYR